jgi:hypothetical protein
MGHKQIGIIYTCETRPVDTLKISKQDSMTIDQTHIRFETCVKDNYQAVKDNYQAVLLTKDDIKVMINQLQELIKE